MVASSQFLAFDLEPTLTEAAVTLAIAAFLDFLIGDPWNWLHPVQIMGWGIHHYTQTALKFLKQPFTLRLTGIFLGLLAIGFSGGLGWLIPRAVDQIHPWLGIATTSILLASCFAGRSLRQAAEAVLAPLAAGDLVQARTKLSYYVGRDTEDLSSAEILRAVLETVTENATDGVMAPLFYALIGACLPVGSASLALAYKAASTLDSMVGYREAPYTNLGWFSARTEDVLTWLPCRLTVLTLSLLSGQPLRVWRICWRDARQDPSPNAGWSECAYAVVLGVQMGGINQYRGKIKQKPLLGEPTYPITPARIRQAMTLTRVCFLLWLGIGIAILLG